MRIKLLSLFAILSFLIVLWINFFNYYYLPNPLSIKSTQFNKLVETFLISYITSYVFYYIVVYLKEERDKKTILPYIANHTYFLINQIRLFVSALKLEAGIPDFRLNMNNEQYTLKDYPTESEWIEIAKINPNTWSRPEGERLNNTYMRIPTFLGDINQKVSNVEYRINKIFSKMQYVEPSYIKILSDIQDNKFHQYILGKGDYTKEILKIPVDDLKLMIENMKDYFESIKKLEEYAFNNLNKFIDNKYLLAK
jgi:hypothetical protein